MPIFVTKRCTLTHIKVAATTVTSTKFSYSFTVDKYGECVTFSIYTSRGWTKKDIKQMESYKSASKTLSQRNLANQVRVCHFLA